MTAHETIVWSTAVAELPDDEETVMIFAPESTEPVWLGYHSAGHWFGVDGFPLDPPTHWAPMPEGPK